jgi:2-polyprenyl-3-methyl-5-hydroxy-6-metoxy-1,4-benzoquinol methylase
MTINDFFSYSKRRLRKMAAFADGKILDVGYGDIPNQYLAGKQVVGIDFAQANSTNNYDAVVIGEATKLPFQSNYFDAIVAGEIIEHLEEPLEFLRVCRRVIKPGGRLVLSTPNPYYPPIIVLNWFMIRRFFYSSDHVFEIAPRFMARFLEQTGFRLRKMVSGGMILPLGRGRYITIPTPKAICYQMIYIAEAV